MATSLCVTLRLKIQTFGMLRQISSLQVYKLIFKAKHQACFSILL